MKINSVIVYIIAKDEWTELLNIWKLNKNTKRKFYVKLKS